MQKLPIVTLRRDIEVKSVNGQLVFDLYKQILKILASDSPRGNFVDLFAEPILNNAKGEITWYTRLPGPVRSLRQLSVSERQSISRELSDAGRTIENISSKLGSSSGGRSFGADALKSIFVVPDSNTSLFSVNGRAVLTQWGCIPFGSDPQSFDVMVQDEASRARIVHGAEIAEEASEPGGEIAEEAAEPGGNPNLDEAHTPVPASTATEANARASSAEASSFPRDEPEPTPQIQYSSIYQRLPWAWLLAAILLLLLLAGIIFHLRPPFLSSVDQDASIRSDIAVLWQEIEAKVSSCVTSIETPDSEGAVTSDDVSDRLNDRAVVEGSVNIALAWRLPVDLDISVTEPSGSVISFKNKVSASGGRLDIDANARCVLVDRPVENISWNSARNPGIYRVNVNLYDTCGTTNVPDTIPFTVVLTNKGSKQEIHKEIQCSHNACNSQTVQVTEFTVE